jgi:hypothetical protein
MSPGDTAVAARIDSLRGVRITLTATNGLTGAEERKRTITRMIRLPNAGLVNRANCGDEPFFGQPVSAVNTIISGKSVVRLTWNASVDENSGEKDVVRYVVWRRRPLDPAFTDMDPYVSIPAGLANYEFIDDDIEPASLEQFFYAVAAQDCTPSLSPLSTFGPVLITN